MSAHLVESDFFLKLASSQSYIDNSYDATPDSVVQPAPRGLLRRLGDGLAFLVQGVKTWSSRHATLSEMALMSDRELADIGLTRVELPRVFDPDFVADHARSRQVF